MQEGKGTTIDTKCDRRKWKLKIMLTMENVLGRNLKKIYEDGVMMQYSKILLK